MESTFLTIKFFTMKRFLPTAMALVVSFLFACNGSKEGSTITITDPESKLAGKQLKEGLNIIEDLKDGYKIGLIRKPGASDEWVTVAPDGVTTRKVTSKAGSDNTRTLATGKMQWRCTYSRDDGWQCVCAANCAF